jgi:hypothetical protein
VTSLGVAAARVVIESCDNGILIFRAFERPDGFSFLQAF